MRSPHLTIRLLLISAGFAASGCGPSAAEKQACTAAFSALERMNAQPDKFIHFQECTNYEPIPAMEGGARVQVHLAVEGLGGGQPGLPPGRVRLAWLEGHHDCDVHGDTVSCQAMIRERGCSFFDAPEPGQEGAWCGAIGSVPPAADRLSPIGNTGTLGDYK